MSRPVERTEERRPQWVIGVTGGIACGKTAVLNQLSEHGVTVIDADRTYHALLEPGSSLSDELIEHFGPEIDDGDGGIDRSKLGAIVFADPLAMQELEALTHPVIDKRIADLIAAADTTVVAVDAVKLLQSRLIDQCDEVWLVTCSRETQIQRLMARNGIGFKDAVRRVEASPVFDLSDARIDAIIMNEGSFADLNDQVERQWARSGLSPTEDGRTLIDSSEGKNR